MRMRTVSSLTFLLLAATASAQDVRITPKFRAGDAFRLEISRTRENSPVSPRDGKSRTTIDVRVLAVTPEGSTLEWEPGATAGDMVGMQEALMLAAGDAMAGMKPVIRLTSDGEVAGLVNEAQVLAKVQAAVDIIRRGLLELAPPANRPGLETMLSQLLSPALLVGTVVRDAQTYFGLNGAELAAGETVTVDITQPNPLGGEPLPAKLSVRAESATADTVVLVTTTTYDLAALMRSTILLMEKAGDRVSPEELAKFPAMQMRDEGRFVFGRAVGLMRELTVNRWFTVAGQKRLDRTEIRLVAPPR
jgi:hypothetical protein